MSLSNEWFDYHLTPRGWELGSSKTDFTPAKTVEPPGDRVLTVHCVEKISSMYSAPYNSEEETYRSADKQAVQSLIEKYGEKPR